MKADQVDCIHRHNSVDLADTRRHSYHHTLVSRGNLLAVSGYETILTSVTERTLTEHLETIAVNLKTSFTETRRHAIQSSVKFAVGCHIFECLREGRLANETR
jgi:hypothetical protein